MGKGRLWLGLVLGLVVMWFVELASAEEEEYGLPEPVFAMSQVEGEIGSPDEPGFPMLDESPAPMRKSERRKGEWKREEVRELVKTFYIWKMTQALELTEEQSVKLIPKLSRIDKEKQEISGKVRELTRKLREELNKEESNKDTLKGIVADILKLRNNQRELELQSEKIAQETLTVEQQAKFIVFLQDFQRQIRRLLQQAKGLRERQGMEEGNRERKRPFSPREEEGRFNRPPPEEFPPEPEY